VKHYGSSAHNPLDKALQFHHVSVRDELAGDVECGGATLLCLLGEQPEQIQDRPRANRRILRGLDLEAQAANRALEDGAIEVFVAVDAILADFLGGRMVCGRNRSSSSGGGAPTATRCWTVCAKSCAGSSRPADVPGANRLAAKTMSCPAV